MTSSAIVLHSMERGGTYGKLGLPYYYTKTIIYLPSPSRNVLRNTEMDIIFHMSKKIFNSPEFLSVKYCRKGEVLVC